MVSSMLIKKIFMSLLVIIFAVLFFASCESSRNRDNREIIIGWSNVKSKNEIFRDEENSLDDAVSYAIYKRNKAAEEKLGIEITARVSGSYDTMLDALSAQVSSSDSLYDAYLGAVDKLFVGALNGFFENLNDIRTLNLNKEYWDQTLVSAYSFGTDRIFFISGDINFYDDYSCQCIYFNKTLANKSEFGFPYEKVKKGEWTLDYLSSTIKDYTKDLNGNGFWEEVDRYGFILSGDSYYGFLNGVGQKILVLDNGILSANCSERFSKYSDIITEKLFRKTTNDFMVENRDIGFSKLKLFNNGSAMYMTGSLYEAEGLSQTSKNIFGIVPYPKFEEKQENYYCTINPAYATAFAILKNTGNTKLTGKTLDMLCSTSEEYVDAAVTSINIKDKASYDMIKIIAKSKTFDLTCLDGSVSGIVEGYATNKKSKLEECISEINGSISLNSKRISAVYSEKNSTLSNIKYVKAVRSSYPMGIIDDRYSDECKLEDLYNIAELGMNTVVLPVFRYGIDSIEHYASLIDSATEYGLKVIINIDILNDFSKFGNDEYKNLAEKAVSDFGQNDSVSAIFINNIDGSSCNGIKEAVRLFEKIEIYPVLTLQPGKDDAKTVSTILKEANISRFCAVSFAQIINGDYKGTNDFYGILKLAKSVSDRSGADYHMMLCCYGIAGAEAPNEDIIRWEQNSAVACGAKGILWSHYCDTDNAVGSGAPFDSNGNKTINHYSLSYSVRYFNFQYGEILNGMRCEDFYLFGSSYGNIDSYSKGTFKGLIGVTGGAGIVSSFQDGSGDKYIVIINNSKKNNSSFDVVFDYSKVQQFSYLVDNGANNAFGDGFTTSVTQTGDNYYVTIFLYPAQIALMKAR